MANPKGNEVSLRESRFKAAWRSGSTRTIRVPIVLAEVTLEYARQLDQGIEPHDTSKISDIGISSATVEPRDTEINANSQVDNPIDTVTVESLKEENEGLKRLLDKKSSLTLGDFYVELQKLRERNRELRLKIGEERHSSTVQISDLKRQLDGVTGKELQNELSNLKAENEKLSADYAALLESSTHLTEKLRQEVQKLRSQLETVRTENEQLKVRSSASEIELLEAADLLNRLKAKRKKSTASLADVEALLEMMEK